MARHVPDGSVSFSVPEAGRSVPKGATVLLTLSGRGDKDAQQLMERLGSEL